MKTIDKIKIEQRKRESLITGNRNEEFIYLISYLLKSVVLHCGNNNQIKQKIHTIQGERGRGYAQMYLLSPNEMMRDYQNIRIICKKGNKLI